MSDEYWLGQVVLVTAELENPKSTVAPLGSHGEALTDDATEVLKAFREDGTAGPIASAAHPSTGVYTAQVTADQPGHWEVNDAKGGVYRFYVKPIRT